MIRAESDRTWEPLAESPAASAAVVAMWRLGKRAVIFALLVLGLIASPRTQAQSVKWMLRAMQPDSSDGAMAFDSARGVNVYFGGDSIDGHPVGTTLGWDGAAWTKLSSAGPSARYGHAMAYDSARGVTVLFGGGQDNAITGETWEWDGVAWKQRLVVGPSPRFCTAMAYDASRHVCVLFGGGTNTDPDPTKVDVVGDTWEWDGIAWTKREGPGPSPRAWHAMVYDSDRHVTVLFGGAGSVDGSFVIDGDTWELDGAGWTKREAAGPAPRAAHAMAYDSHGHTTVVFGGAIGLASDGNAIPDAETWEWNGSVWVKRNVDGPTSRLNHAMAFDTSRNITVLYGGESPDNTGNPTDSPQTWEWNGGEWSQRLGEPPTPRPGGALAYDSAREVAVLFGGQISPTEFTDQTWEWDGATWRQRVVPGPSARSRHTMAFDSDRGVTVLFGGSTTAACCTFNGETWEWDGAVWKQVMVEGPSPRDGSSLVFDSARGVSVLFGGGDSQTWEWDGTVWTLAATTGPSSRAYHAMAYDQRRGVTVLFGGVDVLDWTYQDDTWEWDGAQWTWRATGGPAPRMTHSLAYDSARGVTVLYGGEIGKRPEGGVITTGDTWEWNGSTWAKRIIAGPSPRQFCPMAFDSARGVSVLFGGGSGVILAYDDTWELTPYCPADFNGDGFVNGNDYDEFAELFDIADPGADFNGDGFVNGDDYDLFAEAFEWGC